MTPRSERAWNAFVMHSDPAAYERGSIERAAALANLFMGSANSGGLNSFLTSRHDLDAEEVLDALRLLGAEKSAQQFEPLLYGIGTRLSASIEDERWRILEEQGHDDLDELDTLTCAADEELLALLQTHGAANEAFYSRLA